MWCLVFVGERDLLNARRNEVTLRFIDRCGQQSTQRKFNFNIVDILHVAWTAADNNAETGCGP